MNYDSTADTLFHIKRVNEFLIDASTELLRRGKVHDNSKLEYPEKELFDELTPMLKNLEFGSEEYNESLLRLKPALDHHYAANSHHPQHYPDGIKGMDLFDLIEMFVDWKAAGERTKGGNMNKSIEVNSERFNMSDDLQHIFLNTAHRWKMNF